MLKEKDPDYYKIVDLKNPRRLIRALEVFEATQKPYSSFLGQSNIQRTFGSQILLLQLPRNKLYNDINQRVELMVTAGLEREAQGLYGYKNLPALQTVGYREWFDHFEGKYSREETISEIQKNTRRYAKRQITWFNQLNTHEIPMNDPVKAIKIALDCIKSLS